MAKNLYATMKALPGHREKVASLLTALAENVRAEPGCVRFVVYTLEAEPDLFHVEESYRDEAAFKAHMGTEHGRVFNKAIETLVEGGASKVVFLKEIA
ncbi:MULTISPECIES: putative quinol monooxygenase [Bombella]|uniref:Antibiotic biosynthesis monooxygenase n=2 Tax=Bombella TaxID=1654741 RepID=A0ABT3WM99_9PROT|nr:MULTISPECIES: putative quinol monooxygenase [Bombella]MCT6855102.1 antibiotic biosynthesis monooxygenase [Bombella apis]MCX5614883.1 antibiotic biosynthesis monooxygenase [Bombella saccharophila]MCX5620033.1 antibiotic biosynthesis monooxygenase [Bombella pollinis]PHI96399.1 antibiotic biosynthesis monooxygenase [Parasaccharibacter apium]